MRNSISGFATMFFSECGRLVMQPLPGSALGIQVRVLTLTPTGKPGLDEDFNQSNL